MNIENIVYNANNDIPLSPSDTKALAASYSLLLGKDNELRMLRIWRDDTLKAKQSFNILQAL